MEEGVCRFGRGWGEYRRDREAHASKRQEDICLRPFVDDYAFCCAVVRRFSPETLSRTLFCIKYDTNLYRIAGFGGSMQEDCYVCRVIQLKPLRYLGRPRVV